tara:strand:+ start:351 stop:1148 length:798 start_codon:yes stop_codon:yes gene_type:complete
MDAVEITLGIPALEVENLTVLRSGKVILKDIDFKINKGEFVALVGPNGSGKSTLMLSVLGVLNAQKGNIKIYGNQPMSRNLNGKIGWVSQAASNLPKEIKITVRELVSLGVINATNLFSLHIRDRSDDIDNAIKMVGLEGEQNTDVGRLSGGQRQRAVIARALASNAEFIMLDEPLVGIDRDARNSLLKLLDRLCHQEGKTILMVSHDLTAMRQTAHRIIYLEEGIRYDGHSEKFPDFSTLAGLRGIEHVHDHDLLQPGQKGEEK